MNGFANIHEMHETKDIHQGNKHKLKAFKTTAAQVHGYKRSNPIQGVTNIIRLRASNCEYFEEYTEQNKLPTHS